MEDAARLGLDLSAEDLEPQAEDGIWAEHVPALEGFLAVITQFRSTYTPDGVRVTTGLDYAGARAGLEMSGIEVTPDLWSNLQVIEAGALAGMREDRP